MVFVLIAGCQPQAADQGSHVGVTFTDANFEQEVLQSDMPVLVEFSATWCGPCQMMKPVMATLSDNYEGRVKVGVLDVDDSPTMPSEYVITAVPAMLIFKDGKEVERLQGTRSYEALSKLLDQYVDEPTAASL